MDDSVSQYSFIVRLHDTDAAGRLFFGHLFRHAQDAFESFMAHLGWPIPDLIQRGEWLLPVIHAEADYQRPIHHGELIWVEVGVEEIRRRSFALAYWFRKEDGTETAQARTVHILMSAVGEKDLALPEALRLALARHLKDAAVGVSCARAHPDAQS
ncbi:acyl-CoA thioesterase [Caldichromatium japonicum]|uniref:Acyl-CoA thioesterase n=1 Tax=Caldichromatium japonicum TaxID=2699430 RepID=A0A6G7VD98_9GAMM|nr:acyl-CoA thioesterase [Caldichromatium japonicum]QIK37828.1 acyl-CoA thioesterase [Caldichromatium japonicum]